LYRRTHPSRLRYVVGENLPVGQILVLQQCRG
jgi:hypothetical protein